MKFWDASAVLPLCLQEPHTLNLKRLSARDGALVAWWGTVVECYSALARLRREEALTSADETQARIVLQALMTAWTEIEPSVVVREQAGRVLLLHPLRAADAMQLAAAIVWANGQASGHEFVCLDHRLREAAQSRRVYGLTEATLACPLSFSLYRRTCGAARRATEKTGLPRAAKCYIARRDPYLLSRKDSRPLFRSINVTPKPFHCC